MKMNGLRFRVNQRRPLSSGCLNSVGLGFLAKMVPEATVSKGKRQRVARPGLGHELLRNLDVPIY